MKQKIDYGFEIGQAVILLEPNKRGKIISILQDAHGIQYEVRFWEEISRCLVWVFADEIKSISVEKRLIENSK